MRLTMTAGTATKAETISDLTDSPHLVSFDLFKTSEASSVSTRVDSTLEQGVDVIL